MTSAIPDGQNCGKEKKGQPKCFWAQKCRSKIHCGIIISYENGYFNTAEVILLILFSFLIIVQVILITSLSLRVSSFQKLFVIVA